MPRRSYQERMVEVILRRPVRQPARRSGGRPRKPESHSHVATIQGRVTPPEYVVFQRILAERKAKGLAGFENATEWVRAVLHEQAVALGVPLPAEYHDVRAVRALNWQRAEAQGHTEAENCQTPGCANPVGECGVLCDRCTDSLLANPLRSEAQRGCPTDADVLAAWEQSGGNITKTAIFLGVSFVVARRLLDNLGARLGTGQGRVLAAQLRARGRKILDDDTGSL